MYVGVCAYIGPTITKAVGQNLTVGAIAGLGLAGTVLSLGQAPIARFVSPRVILYGGSLVGIPTSIIVLVGLGTAPLFAVVAVRVAWIVGAVVGENWHALQYEAMAKEGSLSQMKTMIGSVCSAVSLLGVGLVFVAPPSLETAVLLAGCLELGGIPLSWVVARKILYNLP